MVNAELLIRVTDFNQALGSELIAIVYKLNLIVPNALYPTCPTVRL